MESTSKLDLIAIAVVLLMATMVLCLPGIFGIYVADRLVDVPQDNQFKLPNAAIYVLSIGLSYVSIHILGGILLVVLMKLLIGRQPKVDAKLESS